MILSLDKGSERLVPPSKEAIQAARDRQLAAVKALRKFLTEHRSQKQSVA